HAMAFDCRDLDAKLSQRCRDLGADEPETDDDGVASSPRCLADPVAILDRAQLEDAFELCARYRQRLVPSAGRYEQAIVGHGIAMIHDDDLSERVDRRCPDTDPELDVVLLIERGVIDELIFKSVRTAEIALRQGRTVVRQLAFGADEHDVAIPTLLAKDRRRPGTGQRRPHDHDALHVPRIARIAAVSSETPRSGNARLTRNRCQAATSRASITACCGFACCRRSHGPFSSRGSPPTRGAR